MEEDINLCMCFLNVNLLVVYSQGFEAIIARHINGFPPFSPLTELTSKTITI